MPITLGMARMKVTLPVRSNDGIRDIILRYLYDRNENATSRRGKTNGASVTISVMRKELKATHCLTASEIHRNLTYLESMGWVEDRPLAKTFVTKGGGVVPAPTSYYIITAAGIDRIGGKSVFSRDRFEGIRIEATGQNIITLGDGNQVDARFQQLGESLSNLRCLFKESNGLDETQKVEVIVDIDTLQAQLARTSPDPTIVQRLWENINRAASVAGLTQAALQVAPWIAKLTGNG